MQVQIIFTAYGSSHLTGNFGPGDTLRCSAEQARHLVQDAKCARYAQPAQTDAYPPPKTTKPRKAGAKE